VNSRDAISKPTEVVFATPASGCWIGLATTVVCSCSFFRRNRSVDSDFARENLLSRTSAFERRRTGTGGEGVCSCNGVPSGKVVELSSAAFFVFFLENAQPMTGCTATLAGSLVLELRGRALSLAKMEQDKRPGEARSVRVRDSGTAFGGCLFQVWARAQVSCMR
jgi:hypothetical protein